MRFSSIKRFIFGRKHKIGYDLPPLPESKRGMFDPGEDRAKSVSTQELVENALAAVMSAQPRPTVKLQALEADGSAQDEVDSRYFPPQGEPASAAPPAPTMPVPHMPNHMTPNLPPGLVGYFLSNTFIGHQLAGMLAQHWLIGKCCWLPAKDATRKGYDLVTPDATDDTDVVKALRRIDRKYCVNDHLEEFVGFGKIFGIRILLFKVESELDDYYEHPFNPDCVMPGSYRGMVQVDPYWCVPELDQKDLTDPASAGFYEPTWWLINGKRYHRSHLAIYREGQVADILKPSYLYGGIPVPQKIIERVFAAERTASEAPELAMSKRTTVLKTDSAKMLAAGPEALAHLEAWVALRNNYGVKVIGVDEAIEQHDTALSDFDALIMTEFQLVASAANVPSTKLMGTSPKGFGASGDYETESYHEELESIQNSFLTQVVERHHQLAMLSDVAPDMQRKDAAWRIPHIEVTWRPLDTPTAKEVAEVNNLNSVTAVNYYNCDALDGYDIRNQLIHSPDSGYAGIAEMERDEITNNGENTDTLTGTQARQEAGLDRGKVNA